MYLPFDEKADVPHFKECAKHPHVDEMGYVLYFTNQCPFNGKYVPILEKTANDNGILFKAIKIESKEQAQSVPSPCTSYALFTALSAGSGAPDITMLEIDQLDRFKAAQDRFENLYDLGAKDIEDEYLDWKWKTGENESGDFLIGLPTDIGPKALYYRVDLFEEAGLPTDPDEVAALINSPEAFEEAGLKVKEKTGKVKRLFLLWQVI